MNFRLLAVAVLLLVAGACHRAKPPPSPLVQAFINEGAVLRAQTGQGVDLKNFELQLAKAQGAFDVAYMDSKLAPPAFSNALSDWHIALKLWRMERRHKTFAGAGASYQFVTELRADRGEPALKDAFSYLEIHPYVAAYLAEAAEYYAKGVKGL